jgi:hypothetical protein
MSFALARSSYFRFLSTGKRIKIYCHLSSSATWRRKISFLVYQCGSRCREFVRKSLFISCPWFHYVTLKINYKYEANDSKKIYYLFCYIYVEVTKIVRLFLLASSTGKCLDHSFPLTTLSHTHWNFTLRTTETLLILVAVDFLFIPEAKSFVSFRMYMETSIYENLAPFCSQLKRGQELNAVWVQMSRGLNVCKLEATRSSEMIGNL